MMSATIPSKNLPGVNECVLLDEQQFNIMIDEEEIQLEMISEQYSGQPFTSLNDSSFFSLEGEESEGPESEKEDSSSN